MEQLRLEFSDFYTASRDDCLRIVLLSAGERQLAEDLVAKAFARAWASWRKVRVHPAPVAWVVRTALNANANPTGLSRLGMVTLGRMVRARTYLAQ